MNRWVTPVLLSLAISVVGCRRAERISPVERVDASASSPPSTSAPAREVLLFDFGASREVGTAPPRGEHRALATLFPKRLSNAAACRRPVSGDAAKDRQTGQVAPSVLSMASGAFTRSGARETLLIVAVNECSGGRLDDFGSKRVVVLDGPSVVVDVEVGFLSIARVTDLDGDGVDELLLSGGGGTHQGITRSTAALASMKGGSLRRLRDFETVMDDSCGAGRDGSKTEWGRVFVTAGSPLGFRVERYDKPCAGP